MATFAVNYAYAPDSESARDLHRPAHKDFLASLHERGRLRVSGPLGSTGALLVLSGETIQEIESALDADPFWQHGLIGQRTVQPWSIVFGGLR